MLFKVKIIGIICAESWSKFYDLFDQGILIKNWVPLACDIMSLGVGENTSLHDPEDEGTAIL
jgi:hypothetical protein